MIHALGPTGQLILQTLGATAVLLSLILLVLCPFIETIQKYNPIFTPKLISVLFVLCLALIVLDLLFTNHSIRPHVQDG